MGLLVINQGLHCCNNDYGSFNCPTGKDPCSNPDGCGFNQDPTCGATCNANGLTVVIFVLELRPCDTPLVVIVVVLVLLVFVNISVVVAPTQYCDGSAGLCRMSE